MGRRIDVVMTDSKTLFVPIADRPLLGVPEAEALTGVPAKIIRANVRNGLLKACMAGSTTMRIWIPRKTNCRLCFRLTAYQM